MPNGLFVMKKKRAVAFFSGAVLHYLALREPHEIAGAKCALMRLKRSLQDVNAMCTWVRVPDVGEPVGR
jgi:hypothetical protein